MPLLYLCFLIQYQLLEPFCRRVCLGKISHFLFRIVIFGPILQTNLKVRRQIDRSTGNPVGNLFPFYNTCERNPVLISAECGNIIRPVLLRS